MVSNQENLKVIEIGKYAYENSSFYGNYLSENYSKGRVPICYTELPFTSQTDIAYDGGRMLCGSMSEIERIRTFYTSGTTGREKRIYFDSEDIKSTIEFFGVNMKRIAGEASFVMILMSDDKPDSIGNLLKRGLDKVGVKAHIIGRLQHIDLELVGMSEGKCIIGVPVDIIYLCSKYPKLRPYSVLLSGDYISNSLIDNIEMIWRCPVYTHYGLTETCYGLAVQCDDRKGMHIRDKDYFVEIIDPDNGRTLPRGEQGEITITSLRKGIFPLIRYRTGDLGTLIEESCGCGYRGSTLTNLGGRLDNTYEPVNIHRLEDILYGIFGLAGYRAAIKKGKLELVIDGCRLNADEIQKRINYPVSIKYGKCPPWEITGKRSLG